MRLLVVYACSFLVNLILAIVAPFYPIEVERKGAPVWVTGLIFSAMPLVTFVSSPVLGTYLQSIGRRRAFCIGTFCEVRGIQMLSMLLIACSDLLPMRWFAIVGVLARGTAGLGTACIYTASNLYTRFHHRFQRLPHSNE